MTKASQIAEQLHRALAAELLRRVEEGTASPADLNVARQFLKDNGVDALLIEGEPITELAKVLPFKDPDDRITQTG